MRIKTLAILLFLSFIHLPPVQAAEQGLEPIMPELLNAVMAKLYKSKQLSSRLKRLENKLSTFEKDFRRTGDARISRYHLNYAYRILYKLDRVSLNEALETLQEETLTLGRVNTRKSPLTIRSKPARGSTVLGRAPKDSLLIIINDEGDWWYAQQYLGRSKGSIKGYVAKQYVALLGIGKESDGMEKESKTAVTKDEDEAEAEAEDNDTTDEAEEERGVAALVKTPRSALRIREKPDTASAVLGGAPKGAELRVLGEHDDIWYKVLYDDIEGYAARRYIQLRAH